MQFDHDYERIIPTSLVTGVDTITFGGSAGIDIPAGTTAQRPAAPIAGSLRFNTTTNTEEVYSGTAWISPITSILAGTNITVSQTGSVVTINSGSGGSVSSVGLALPSMFSVTGSPITTSGTLTATLASQTTNTVLAAPVGGGVPTFRALSLAQNDISDVLISTPTVGQILVWNGTDFVNTGSAVATAAAGLVGAGQTGAAAWTLVTGSTYVADFTHNLGTLNVVVTVFDSSTNAVVIPDLTTLTSTNNVRIQVIGNTRTLRVVVLANGISITGSASASLAVAKDGTTIAPTTTTLNFSGQAVSVVDAGAGQTNVTIGARYSYFANSLDTPNNADFAVNALAPVTTDSLYPSLNVRSFSNTVEQGVGFTCSIPTGVTQLTLRFRGRASTAPGAISVVQPRLYYRLLPNNAAVGAWSAAQELTNIGIPTNAYFQYAQQTVTLASLGLVAGNLYQFEMTRRVTGVTGTNLASAFLLAELTAEFS